MKILNDLSYNTYFGLHDRDKDSLTSSESGCDNVKVGFHYYFNIEVFNKSQVRLNTMIHFLGIKVGAFFQVASLAQIAFLIELQHHGFHAVVVEI